MMTRFATCYSRRKTDDLLQEIENLQYIQKTHPSRSKAWRDASAQLAPLFEEMARRQALAEG